MLQHLDTGVHVSWVLMSMLVVAGTGPSEMRNHHSSSATVWKASILLIPIGIGENCLSLK